MRFTMARPDVSCHPERLVEGARTVISAALCYAVPGDEPAADEGRLARYTWWDAYEDLREKLGELGRLLGGRHRVLVDSNDHVDREGAVRAGLGFYGKNTMVITPSHGSWVVLGTLVTEAEVDTSPPVELDCGSCTLCVDACPTGALDEPGVLDSTRCLSYWTQAPEPIPTAYRDDLGATVYGCDICQDVCPFNQGAPASEDPVWQPRPLLKSAPVAALWRQSDAAWRSLTKGSAMTRAKVAGLRRNLAVAAGNSGADDARAALVEPTGDPAAADPLVREHMRWALEQRSGSATFHTAQATREQTRGSKV
jgi:epoxyqueuosine reductase